MDGEQWVSGRLRKRCQGVSEDEMCTEAQSKATSSMWLSVSIVQGITGEGAGKEEEKKKEKMEKKEKKEKEKVFNIP